MPQGNTLKVSQQPQRVLETVPSGGSKGYASLSSKDIMSSKGNPSITDRLSSMFREIPTLIMSSQQIPPQVSSLV